MKATFALPYLDKEQITKAIDETMQRSVRQAAAEFYRKVWQLAFPYIDTGMMQGSLVPLGRVLNNVPTVFVSNRAPRPPEKHHYPRGKSPQVGMDIGEDMFEFTGNIKTNGTYTFIFRNKIFHWKINEEHWQIIDAGVEAFRGHISYMRISKQVQQIIKKNLRYRVRTT